MERRGRGVDTITTMIGTGTGAGKRTGAGGRRGRGRKRKTRRIRSGGWRRSGRAARGGIVVFWPLRKGREGRGCGGGGRDGGLLIGVWMSGGGGGGGIGMVGTDLRLGLPMRIAMGGEGLRDVTGKEERKLGAEKSSSKDEAA